MRQQTLKALGSSLRHAGVLFVVPLAGCGFFQAGARPAPVAVPAPLEPLPVEYVVEPPTVREPMRDAPIARTPDRLVTLTATNVSVRELLPLLADAAGVNLVLAPEVDGRITVRFQDVPAGEALDAVMQHAGLSTPAPPLTVPWIPAVVFFELPVNVNGADALTLQRRFGITQRSAEWIVSSRPENWRR